MVFDLAAHPLFSFVMAFTSLSISGYSWRFLDRLPHLRQNDRQKCRSFTWLDVTDRSLALQGATEVAWRFGLPSIGDLIQKCMHAVFGHVICLNPSASIRTPHAETVSRHLYETSCPSWVEKASRTSTLHLDRSIKKGQGCSNCNRLITWCDRRLWRVDATALHCRASQYTEWTYIMKWMNNEWMHIIWWLNNE